MDTTNFNGLKVPSIIQTLKPKSADWREVASPLPAMNWSITETAWFHKDGFFVISAVEKVFHGGELGERTEYHLSFSRRTAFGVFRVTSNQAQWILNEFGCEGAREDNHVPGGKARNFWRPVSENLVGIECACVKSEPVIRENKGDYIWRPV